MQKKSQTGFSMPWDGRLVRGFFFFFWQTWILSKKYSRRFAVKENFVTLQRKREMPRVEVRTLKRLEYGVMVTLQILVLSFQVRVLVLQHLQDLRKGCWASRTAAFFWISRNRCVAVRCAHRGHMSCGVCTSPRHVYDVCIDTSLRFA